MNVTVLLGAPGSGKGTQAKKLSQQYKFVHLSTGDMLRSAIRGGTALGKEAQSFMDRGELVPDGTMIGLIDETVGSLPGSSKVLLDGFPRTFPQAEALSTVKAAPVGKVVFFKVPEVELVRRLTGRRVCSKCGESFHLISLPPKQNGICDSCGGSLIQRPDDSEEVVHKRLAIFSAQNNQLLDFYRRQGKLVEVDANQPVEALQAALLKILS